MKKNIAIIGSTGSIGTQALEVIEKLKDKFNVIGLSAGSNADLLSKQIEKFHPEYVSVSKPDSAEELKNKYKNITVFYGDEGASEIAELDETDTVLVSVSGRAGLIPTIKAVKKKKNVALANKETLVMAGDIVMKLARENGVRILPVDSEHSAVFQCLTNRKAVKRLIITASGGPFLNASEDELEKADLDRALNHPRWKMGRKITVDSATLMNKGLEVIEAHHLFNIKYEDIKIVIHPQSYIHSAVEYIDGAIIAQIGIPSMHIPVQYALMYPERVEGIETESFDFVKAGKFEFYEPDFEKFPLLKLAVEAGKRGGSAPVCLNASNEEAVTAFLDRKIKFTDIYKITKSVYDNYKPVDKPSIEEIISEDEKIRLKTKNIIDNKDRV